MQTIFPKELTAEIDCYRKGCSITKKILVSMSEEIMIVTDEVLWKKV